MTRSLLVLLAGALLAGAAHAQIDPALKLSLAPMRELNEIFTRIVTIGGKPEKAESFNAQLKQMGLGEGAGLQTTKRWGAFVEFPKGDAPKAAIVVPVKDEKEFLAGLKPFFPQQDKDGERWRLVSQSMPPLVAQVKDGYAYLTMTLPSDPNAPTPILKEPAKALEGDGTLQIVLEAARLGGDLKENLVPGIKKASGADKAPPDQQAAISARFDPLQGQADMVQKTLDPFERVTLAIKVSSTLPEIHFTTIEVTKKSATKDESVPSLGYASLVPDASPAAMQVDMPLVGRFREMVEKGIADMMAKASAAKDPAEKAKYDQVVEEMNRILKMGRLEGFLFTEGNEGKLTGYGLARLAPDSQVAQKLDPILTKGAPSGEKPVKSEDAGTTYWSIASKPTDPSPAKTGALAFGKGFAAFAISAEATATDKLKALVAKLGGAKPGSMEGIRGRFSAVKITELGDPFEMKKTDEGKKKHEEMLAAGPDDSSLVVDRTADGHRLEITLKGYPVAWFYKETVKDKTPPPPMGQPGLPSSSPEPLAPPTPERSAAPEVPAPPAATESPAASPSASEGEEEKSEDEHGETKVKTKGGDDNKKKSDGDE